MPRPRAEDYLDEIAAGLAEGWSYSRIAEQLGVSRGVVQNRVNTLRHRLLEETGEARWVTDATTVQVGREWTLRVRGEDA